jgi:outer membrane lipoprotein carrier protein
MKLFLVMFSLSALVSKPVAAAAPESTAAAIQAVETLYEGVTSIQADFVQLTRSIAMGTEDRQEGNMAVMRPSMMRWEFTAPDAALMVSDGEQMWIYSPAEAQVIQYGVGASQGGVESLLSDLATIQENFNVALVTVDGALPDHFALKLEPKTAQSFRSIVLELQEDSLTIGRVTIVDSFDNETILTLSSVVLNGSVDSAQFAFEVPAGVELIRTDAM